MVIRHDKPDKDYLERAKQFPQIFCLDAPKPNMGMATLIHPRWLLTAAHCAKHLLPERVVSLGEQRQTLEEVITHPSWRSRPNSPTQDNLKDVADLALLKLCVASDLEPLPLYKGRAERGSCLTLVGKGMTGTGLTGAVHDDGRFRAVTNVVEEVLHEQWLIFCFDKPLHASNYEGVGGKGDSGSPALVLGENGGASVVGVASWEDSQGNPRTTYGVSKYYTNAAFYADWIESVIEHRD